MYKRTQAGAILKTSSRKIKKKERGREKDAGYAGEGNTSRGTPDRSN